MKDEIEEQSREEYLDKLIKDFKRKQTIQDVGLFLVNFPAYRLPNRLSDVLSKWLEKTSDRKIVYSHEGRPKTDLTNYFPLIDGMRVTGMSVYAACNLIIKKLELHDVKSINLQKKYGQIRTPLSRLIDDFAFGPARINKPGGSDFTYIEKAFERFGLGPIDTSLDRRIEKLAERFSQTELRRAVDKLPTKKTDTNPEN